MNRFSVGDRIAFQQDRLIGEGVIEDITPRSNRYVVQVDRIIKGGSVSELHDCGGRLPADTGWYVEDHNAELIESAGMGACEIQTDALMEVLDG